MVVQLNSIFHWLDNMVSCSFSEMYQKDFKAKEAVWIQMYVKIRSRI